MVKNLPAMQEPGVWSLDREGPLEKGMATHSSILAWRIPWTEEPGGLQSMGHKESEATEHPNTPAWVQKWWSSGCPGCDRGTWWPVAALSRICIESSFPAPPQPWAPGPAGASNPWAFPGQLALLLWPQGFNSSSFANFSTFHLLKTPPFNVHCFFPPILFFLPSF